MPLDYVALKLCRLWPVSLCEFLPAFVTRLPIIAYGLIRGNATPTKPLKHPHMYPVLLDVCHVLGMRNSVVYCIQCRPDSPDRKTGLSAPTIDSAGPKVSLFSL